MQLARADPRRLGEFPQIHHLGVKALALYDDEMLRLVEGWWPMETNVGRMTLAEFRERYGVIRYTATADQFRQLAGVAAAQDVAVAEHIRFCTLTGNDALEMGGAVAAVELLGVGDLARELRERALAVSADQAHRGSSRPRGSRRRGFHLYRPAGAGAWAALRLAELQTSAGRPDEARGTLQRAAESLPADESDLRERLAWALENLDEEQV